MLKLLKRENVDFEDPPLGLHPAGPLEWLDYKPHTIRACRWAIGVVNKIGVNAIRDMIPVEDGYRSSKRCSEIAREAWSRILKGNPHILALYKRKLRARQPEEVLKRQATWELKKASGYISPLKGKKLGPRPPKDPT